MDGENSSWNIKYQVTKEECGGVWVQLCPTHPLQKIGGLG